ncbi:MAG: L-seryl-tRNA(Sec) selenium transferase [Kiritimatiellae bacterium]|nr:L-seryl-tRNA(Sec) selenium transferase [Kiritimatiellia bacterium]MDD5520130.1 L-seryl-tRNA(Sec) selenium transferase [Kiritimatiellia bacterium]
MSNTSRDKLKELPSVDSVLNLPKMVMLVEVYGHVVVAGAIRQTIETLRNDILEGKKLKPEDLTAESVAEEASSAVSMTQRSGMKRTVNATGIILHTGLGRAVMPDAVREPLSEAIGYCNVQMDLETGERIRRESCILDLVRELTGAEDAALVNNNAGATLLVLRALAKNREVIISRGELIEIGGSFRLPDIMNESGAILREIGTTNKTHPRDYESAISPKTGLLMKAHKSNFNIVGFSEEVDISQIAEIGKKHGITVVDDLGCGALIPLEQFGLPHEVTVKESLMAGADIVLFSTDKLIGGPQGGLIVGRKDLIETIRKQPLYRVIRVCKLTIAALEATLKLFRSPDLLVKKHPIYKMLAKSPVELETQALKVSKLISKKCPDWKVSVVKTITYLGGGSLPGAELPSFAVRISSGKMSADAIAKMFRMADVPVIPHISDDAVLLDMRTVSEDEIGFVVKAVAAE